MKIDIFILFVNGYDHHLDRCGESNSLVVEIKHRVVCADENIPKNPAGSHWGIQIETNQARDTGGRGTFSNLEDVLLTSERESAARNDEGEEREASDIVTRAEDTLAFKVCLAAELVVDLSDISGGTSDEGGTGITDGAAAGSRAKSHGLAIKDDIIHIDGPVSLREERGIGDGTSVVRGIDTSQNELASDRRSVIFAQPEGEDVVLDEVLVHNIVPDRGDRIHRDALEGKTKDTIKGSSNKGNSGLASGLSEDLVLDKEVRDPQVVLAQKSL